MMLNRVSIIALAVIFAGSAQAQEPAAVASAKAEFRRECISAGYKGSFRTGFVKTADFNGDGKVDYIIDTSRMECGSFYCGTAGCVVAIVMSGPQDYTEGFRENLRDWMLLRVDKKDVLRAGLHGSECDRAGNHTCYVTFTWRVDGFVKNR